MRKTSTAFSAGLCIQRTSAHMSVEEADKAVELVRNKQTTGVILTMHNGIQ